MDLQMYFGSLGFILHNRFWLVSLTSFIFIYNCKKAIDGKCHLMISYKVQIKVLYYLHAHFLHCCIVLRLVLEICSVE